MAVETAERETIVAPLNPNQYVIFAEPSTPYNYAGIADPSLKRFLERGEERLIGQIKQWPVPLSQIESVQFYDVLGLKWKDLHTLVKGVRQHKLIPYLPILVRQKQGNGTVASFDQQRMRAFLAYTWGFSNKLGQLGKKRGDIPWGDIFMEVRAALDIHPLIIFFDIDFLRLSGIMPSLQTTPRGRDAGGTVSHFRHTIARLARVD